MADENKELKLPEWSVSSPVTVENMNALNAGIVQAAPVGSFTWYFGSEAPAGWLICDGRRDLSAYPSLQAHLAKLGLDHIPNMLSGGLFVRSVTSDKSRIAKTESSSVGSHNHAFRHRHNSNFAVDPTSTNNHFVGKKYTTGDLGRGYVVASTYTYNRRYLKTGPAVDNSNSGNWENSYTNYNSGSDETYPANIALLPIIKY